MTTSGHPHLPALGPWPQRMVNSIRAYDWGSTSQLARMQSRRPSGEPEAELWMGAHPSAPSALVGLDGTVRPLDLLLQQHPQTLLGADVLARHGARLPFLLKVLAIARPLSLQVHPDPERARQAWAAQVTAGATPPHLYADPYAKPELLYALRPVDAMCGFRDAADAAALLERLGCPRLAPVLETLTSSAQPRNCLKEAFALLVGWPSDDRPALVADVAEHARRLLRTAERQGPGGLDAQRRAVMWASRLAALHPKDSLVAAPFLLDVVQLRPGETLFVPAGAPHAYLWGVGVEIMANSDNVVRAGLTHKEIAADELLQVVDGDSRPVRDLAEVRLGPHEVAWRPDVEEFQLSRLRLPDSTPVAAYPHVRGPQILLCTAGTVGVATQGHAVALWPGDSAFVGASGGPLTLAGPGEVFRATVGEPIG